MFTTISGLLNRLICVTVWRFFSIIRQPACYVVELGKGLVALQSGLVRTATKPLLPLNQALLAMLISVCPDFFVKYPDRTKKLQGCPTGMQQPVSNIAGPGNGSPSWFFLAVQLFCRLLMFLSIARCRKTDSPAAYRHRSICSFRMHFVPSGKGEDVHGRMPAVPFWDEYSSLSKYIRH